jgi:hypothetical protein
MFKLLRGGITFSNVVALLALFLALGGTVYAAGKLSGKQIKPNSIPGNRVKKHSLTGTQLKANAVKGVASANAIAHVTYQSANATISPSGTGYTAITATCPTGLKALGGTASVGNPVNSYVNDFNFTSDHSGYVARIFTGGGISGTETDNVIVTAVCVPVTATTP